MKNIKAIYLGLGLLLLGSCSSEAPFDGIGSEGSGRLLTSSFEIEVVSEDIFTRAVVVPTPEQFNVNIYKTSDGSSVYSGTPVQSYLYKEMPEVLTLPVGNYIATVTYGGDYGEGRNAAFDAPYYLGESDIFTITQAAIVDDLAPIVARPANVKVSVDFDKTLLDVMGEGSKVSVRVGESGVLDFTPETDADGYFAYDEGSTTLTATFIGIVDGNPTTEIKTFDGVKAGLYYRVTFRLHKVDPNDPNYPDDPNNPNNPDNPDDPNNPNNPDDPNNPDVPGNVPQGDIVVGNNGGLRLDATVTYHDRSENSSFSPGNDEYLVDDMRPGSNPSQPGQDNPGGDDPSSGTKPGGDDPGPNDPGKDDPGIDNPVVHNKPSVEGVDGTSENNVNPSIFHVLVTSESEKGFTAFTVDIDSETLTPSELEGVGLPQHIDLVNPGSIKDSLMELGFPVEDQVLGKKSAYINIDQFLDLLKILGNGTSKFIFNVTDEYGTTTKTLSITYK